MEIVLAEERERGWQPAVIGGWAKEKEHGCDILSTPPGETQPHPVEVKGWGEPMLSPRRKFTYGQDIRTSQLAAAKLNPNYRIEIVANLDAHLRGEGGYQRLTLTAEQISTRATPRLYGIPLDGFISEVRSSSSSKSATRGRGDDPRGSGMSRCWRSICRLKRLSFVTGRIWDGSRL